MEITTQCPSYNAGRLFLEPDNATSHVGLELDRTRSGIRMYLNLYLLLVPPYADDPSRACVKLIIEGEEALIFYPYRLAGCQKILFPEDVTNYIIELLLNDQSFILNLGRNQINVIPDKFQEAYEKLMEIEIE
ncbi:MAG: hypothetical protein H0W88_01065 [Parachlamydiaceae bacterium]|nr:hypothetical protein [Parachlamydiaceae bacterium]